VKSSLPAGVLLLSIAGISAYAITALMAEANLRTGTATKTPMEAIEKSLSVIRTGRHSLDDITKRWAPGSSKLDDDQVAEQSPERIR
jgi:hypothetical protein